jgi:hypothetical protein
MMMVVMMVIGDSSYFNLLILSCRFLLYHKASHSNRLCHADFQSFTLSKPLEMYCL